MSGIPVPIADHTPSVQLALPRLFYVAAVVIIVSGIMSIGVDGYLIYCQWQIQSMIQGHQLQPLDQIHRDMQRQ